MKSTSRFFLFYFFTVLAALLAIAAADDTSSSTPTPAPQISTITKPDGTTITIITETDGTVINTISEPSGVISKTINQPDGTTIKITTYSDGSFVKTTIAPDGTITTQTSSSSSNDNSSNTGTTSPTPSDNSTPAPSPPPTPTPTTPLVAPFTISLTPVYFYPNDQTDLFLMSSSCISVDQWAAFLNAVAKYTDTHELYYDSMANAPQTRTDIHGTTIPAPRLAQIKKEVAADGSCTYSVLNRDQNANVFGADDMTNKDLPVAYIDLCAAARFCNWLHHGEPAFGPSDNPDDATEGGAYLIDEGFNATFNRYEEARSCITLMPGALWRLPSYVDYNGIHHVAGKNTSTPDYSQQGNDFSQQSVPTGEINGFFDNYSSIWLWQYAHYELTSTHVTFCANAQRLYNVAPGKYGAYYVVKSPTLEKQAAAESRVPNFLTHISTITKDSDTSFRVVPLGPAIPSGDASPSP